MDIFATEFPEVGILKPRRFFDNRGYFSETYSRKALGQAGIDTAFVQDNLSYSAAPGTVRGLHFQGPPFAQDKLVVVLRGAVLDVVVDIRCGSPSFGRHILTPLSAADGTQVFVPAGFAHGFCTLEPDCLVLYKVSAPYAPACEGGILWNDPALGIAWPVSAEQAVLSEKDTRLPLLSALPEIFTWVQPCGLS